MLLYQEVRESLLNGTRTAMSPLPTAPIYKTSCAGSSTTPRRNRLALLLQRPPLRSVCCLVTQLCLILFNSMDCSRPGSSVLGISQVGYWSVSPSGDLSKAGIETMSPALQADSLLLSHRGSPSELYMG